jgi:competence protein ComEC
MSISSLFQLNIIKATGASRLVRPTHPFRWFGIGFAFAMWLQLMQTALWPAWVYNSFIVFSVILAVVYIRLRKCLIASSTILLAGCLCGFALAGLQGQLALSGALESALEGNTITASGTVSQLPSISADSVRFSFDLDAPPAGVPQRVQVAWFEPAAPALITPGARFRLELRLRAVHGTLNHHGFDYELYQLERGITALATVRPRGEKTYLGEASLLRHPSIALEHLRWWLKQRIDTALKDAPYKGVVQALAVGDQSAIDRDDWRTFRDTGVGHLMSISGLHVTMFAWLAGVAVAWLWRRSSRLMLAVPAPTAARWSGLFVACAYAAIAGWGVPAQRTVLMLAVSTLALQSGLRYAWFDVLLAALVVVISFDPWALLQPGFWLSFSAVGFLFWASPENTQRSNEAQAPRLQRMSGELKAAAHTQAVATIALVPLSILFFQQVSLVSPLANAVAIPLVSLVVTPIAVIGLLLPAPLSTFAWQLAHALLSALQWGLELLVSLPHAIASLPTPSPLVLGLALIGTVVLVAPAIGALRWLGVVMLLPLLLIGPTPPKPGEFQAEFMDIGQGNAVLIRTRSHALLYDTGPAYMSGADAGERLVLPLLRALGVHELDALIVSHRDSDHSGGAEAVLQALPVKRMLTSMSAQELPEASRAVIERCVNGQSWQWDGVQFEMLWPIPDLYAIPLDAAKPPKPNALSCVLKITAASGNSVLLMADAEWPQEAQMQALHAGKLKSTVLLVGHHGSKTSSSASFLNAVAPRAAVVQAGYRSSYGHPHPSVMARYIERHIAVRRADCEGGLAWSSDAPALFNSARAERWRYWRHVGGTHNGGLSCKGTALASDNEEPEKTEAP